jgi:chitodextrinase
MIKRLCLSLVLSFSLLTPVAYSAISSDFSVQTIIGQDTNPPTIPTGLVAIPIASSQINVSWLAATDDFLLSGYQVFRDGIQIATTSTTSFSDTGLLAETLYTYFVRAFDSFGNVSTSSSLVSTTTLTIPVPPPTPTTTPGRQTTGTDLFQLKSLRIIPETNQIRLQFETPGAIRPVVRWGRTGEFELGSSVGQGYARVHDLIIPGLRPETLYQITISGEHTSGLVRTLATRAVTTLPLDDMLPPANVSDFRVTARGEDGILSWKNPIDSDFSQVRVLRRFDFFPVDEADGWLVYEGAAEEARDAGVVREGRDVYYTIFSYDTTGNQSSGAVARLRVTKAGEVTPVVPSEPPPSNDIALNFSDLIITQNGHPLLHDDSGRIIIDGAESFTIALPYERVPENLKTILVTLTHPERSLEVFSFLLRANRDQTAYTATVAPLGEAGKYPLTVTVYDFTTTGVGYASGFLTVELLPTAPFDSGATVTIVTEGWDWRWLFLLCLCGLLIVAYRLVRPRRVMGRDRTAAS